MTRQALLLAHRLQSALLQLAGGGPLSAAPRVLLDGWATLYRWHAAGQRVTRLTAEHEDAILDNPLPQDLDLAEADLRHEAIGIELSDRRDWIVIARHAPAPCEVVVQGEIRWAYGQPLLTFVTEIGGDIKAGYFNLAAMPTPDALALRPGIALTRAGVRALAESETLEEDYRVALAIPTLYRQHR